ncbi:MAG: aminotransferase class V-fold PLP-dependent enzyme [Actinomycetota bacterium]
MRTDLGWRLDPDVTFLNHGSFGSCPEPVLAVQREWRDRMERDPIRFLDRELEGHLDRTREALGAFLGAAPAGLAFVPNATTGVNAVLRSLHFGPGEEILTCDHEYNATLTTVRAVAERDGARVVLVALPYPSAGPGEIVDAVLGAVTPRTRLAVVSHVTSSTALVLPIERIVAELDARGIDTLVDGAHAPGMVPLSLDALGAAYYSGNGHKWLCAPKGAGFLWVREDRRSRVHPTIVSHGANDPRTDRSRFRLEFDWVGTVDPTPALTMPAAIDWVGGLEPGGWPAVMHANRSLALAARDRLAAVLGVAPPAPDALVGSMAAVPIPGLTTDADANDLHLALVDERIEVPVHGWPVRGARPAPIDPPRAVVVRVSVQRYTEPDDIERLVGALGRRLTAE